MIQALQPQHGLSEFNRLAATAGARASKLHALTDGEGRRLRFLLAPGKCR